MNEKKEKKSRRGHNFNPDVGKETRFKPGNEFWKARSSFGTGPIFANPEQLWAACCEYFEWVNQNPLLEMQPFAYQGAVMQEPVPKMRAMTVEGLYTFLNIGKQTWYDYCSKPAFADVCDRINSVIKEQKFTGAAAGLLNPVIIARDLGLKDSTSTEVTGKDGGPIQSVAQVDVAGLSTEHLKQLLALSEQLAKKNGE